MDSKMSAVTMGDLSAFSLSSGLIVEGQVVLEIPAGQVEFGCTSESVSLW